MVAGSITVPCIGKAPQGAFFLSGWTIKTQPTDFESKATQNPGIRINTNVSALLFKRLLVWGLIASSKQTEQNFKTANLKGLLPC